MLGENSNGHIYDLQAKYLKRILKKVDKQQGAAKILVWRTCNTALMVLDEVEGIPFEKLAPSLYFISLDMHTRELTQRYEAMLELAGAAPDKFLDSLHKEMNALSIFIKKNDLLPELFEMVSLCDQLRMAYHKNNPQAIHIMNAYQNVLLQTLEYMRPSKFDFTVAVCGRTMTGEVMTVPEFFPNGDMISLQLNKWAFSGHEASTQEQFEAEFRKIAAQCGYPTIKTISNLDLILNVDRLHTNQRASIYPYVNEFTYDMVPLPEAAFKGNMEFLSYLFLPGVDMEAIDKMLQRRAKTLPSNGIEFRFEYSSGGFSGRVPESKRITKVRMKETYYNGYIVMLYNIIFDGQTLIGYYNTTNGFLSSLLLGANDFSKSSGMYQKVRALILYLYAAATARETEKMLKDFTELAYLTDDENSKDFPEEYLEIHVTAYGQGGRPRNQYHSGDGSRVNDDRYEAVARPIQGYIRRLPAGQSASQAAKDRAVSLGFDLAENETYVQPFIRNVLRLKANVEADG